MQEFSESGLDEILASGEPEFVPTKEHAYAANHPYSWTAEDRAKAGIVKPETAPNIPARWMAMIEEVGAHNKKLLG